MMQRLRSTTRPSPGLALFMIALLTGCSAFDPQTRRIKHPGLYGQ